LNDRGVKPSLPAIPPAVNRNTSTLHPSCPLPILLVLSPNP
jgi:hypothetical protein